MNVTISSASSSISDRDSRYATTVALPVGWSAVKATALRLSHIIDAIMRLDIASIRIGIVSHYLPAARAQDVSHIIANYPLDIVNATDGHVLYPYVEPLTNILPWVRCDWIKPDLEGCMMERWVLIDELVGEYVIALNDNVPTDASAYKLLCAVSGSKGDYARYESSGIFRNKIKRHLALALLGAMYAKHVMHEMYGTWLFAKGDGGADDVTQVNLGWYGIAMQVAEGRVFGNYKDVMVCDVHDVCAYLVMKKQENDKMRAEMNKNG